MVALPLPHKKMSLNRRRRVPCSKFNYKYTHSPAICSSFPLRCLQGVQSRTLISYQYTHTMRLNLFNERAHARFSSLLAPYLLSFHFDSQTANCKHGWFCFVYVLALSARQSNVNSLNVRHIIFRLVYISLRITFRCCMAFVCRVSTFCVNFRIFFVFGAKMKMQYEQMCIVNMKCLCSL